MAWNQNNDKNKWNQKEETSGYYEKDAQILRLSCWRFSDNMRELTGFCPFSEAVALAAYVDRYTALFTSNNSIRLLPLLSSKEHHEVSFEGIEWLFYESIVRLQHVRHGLSYPDGEYKIERYKMDGYIANDNVIQEYHGSWVVNHFLDASRAPFSICSSFMAIALVFINLQRITKISSLKICTGGLWEKTKQLCEEGFGIRRCGVANEKLKNVHKSAKLFFKYTQQSHGSIQKCTKVGEDVKP